MSKEFDLDMKIRGLVDLFVSGKMSPDQLNELDYAVAARSNMMRPKRPTPEQRARLARLLRR